ncbi:outer membrane protein assembly factor [Candidatus Margulisiibacteriota bacterium]
MNTIKEPIKKTRKKKIKRKKGSNTIKEIVIKGNKRFNKDLILNEITLEVGDELSPFKVRRNVKNIKDLGLFADVSSTVEKVSNGRKLIFTVKENPVIGKIIFKNANNIGSEELLEVIWARKGKILNKVMLRKDIQKIRALYMDKGYTQAKVFKTDVPKKNNDPLVFHIGEGIITEITITGNRRTQDYVILREMETKPGMIWNEEQIREDLRKVFNLNFFENIQPELLPDTKNNTYKLRINLMERPTNAAFTFGGGYSPTMGSSLFSDLYWDNLFGSGQMIMLKGQFGRATTYQVKYHNPWMWDERKSLTLRTWLTDGEIGSVNPMQQGNILFRNERRKGVDVALGWPFSYELRTRHKLSYETVTLLDVDKAYKVHSYTFGISYDSRDVWFNPSKGDFYTFSVEKGFKLTNDSLDLTRYDLGLRKFIPTFQKQTIGLRLDFGYITSPEIDDQDIFRSQWYYVGGSTTVRGYDDQYPFAYGSKQILANIEYRFLFNDMFQAVLFVDAGYASSGKILDASKFRIGKGVGVRINIPGLGPLRLDYGIDDLGTGRIHFNLGHAF